MVIYEKWFGHNSERYFGVYNFKKIRKQNYAEYGNDPDINIKRKWGVHTNGARKGRAKCLDFTLSLGHIEFNYIDFGYGRYIK